MRPLAPFKWAWAAQSVGMPPACVDGLFGPIKYLLIMQTTQQLFVVALVLLDDADRFQMGWVIVFECQAHAGQFTAAGAQCFFDHINVADTQIKTAVVARHVFSPTSRFHIGN